jgi:porin
MKMTKGSFVLFFAIICLMVMGPRTALCASADEDLEQRVERLEKKLEVNEQGAGSGQDNGALQRISIGAVAAGTYQYQSVDDAAGYDDTGRGAFAFQPEISFALSEKDEFFAKFGFAAGDALNAGKSPFTWAPWAADLEADAKNINGRDRDYLLTAWYKHTFDFSEDNALGLTGGLVDATDYLDENVYANDEYTQFMNQTLVNGPNGFLPSYDLGGALEWDMGDFALRGVVMGIGENDDGRSYTFYGAQLGYTLNSGLGEGNYRVIADWTSKDFSNPAGDKQEAKNCVLLSFDQELGDLLGAWIRFGWQDDSAAVTCDKLYSGGVDISGKLWGREQDNIGIGYACLDGANQNLDSSHVFEAYVRFLLNEYFALTADVQYLKDNMKTGDDPKGFISGLRLVAEF